MTISSLIRTARLLTFRVKHPKALLTAALLSGAFHADAQCLTSSLDLGTGISNGISAPASGSPDYHWDIVSVSPALQASLPYFYSTPTDALVVTPNGAWNNTMLSPSQWLSIDNRFASPGYNNSASGTLYTTTYRRAFRTCQDGDVSFDLKILNDNYITAIRVDGAALPAAQAYNVTGTNTFTVWNVTYAQGMGAGAHNIEIDVQNAPVSNPTNPTGICIQGTVSCSSAIFVNDNDVSCQDYVCGSGGCSDECYWKVTGNNILNGNNIFGTLSKSAVRIKTEGNDRGILTAGGPNSSDLTAGRLGWNTMSPTARLHVDCRYGNNPQNAPTATSDVRFENLEPGQGYLLVIDDRGYIYNSRVTYTPPKKPGGPDELEELKAEIGALRVQLRDLSAGKAVATAGDMLYQNAPNPFGKETTIGYNVQSMEQTAFIMIYDLNGRELSRYPVLQKGRGSITVNSAQLQPGMYLYALIVDGREADMKKMVVSGRN